MAGRRQARLTLTSWKWWKIDGEADANGAEAASPESEINSGFWLESGSEPGWRASGAETSDGDRMEVDS